MNARLLFFPIALALVAVVAVLAVAGAPGGEPTPTVSDPEPAPDPPPTTTTVVNPVESARVTGLERRLAATRKARARDRYRYRRALQAVIHSPTVGGHPLEKSFQCIHSGEGRWADPDPPYWGGIQMDRSFMRAYMPWAYRYFGTADNWPISVQIAAGIHAVISGRGFYPWPNTARMCGLIR